MEASLPQVVVISHADDPHISLVEPHLAGKAQLIVIDQTKVLEDVELSFGYGSEGSYVIYDGKLLDNVVGAWYRKPQPFTDDLLSMDKELKEYALSALSRHCEQILVCFPSALWVSEYYTQMRAAHKIGQYALAAQLGFRVPTTLFTTSAIAAERFVAEQPPTIVKTLANTYPRCRVGTHSVFERKWVAGEATTAMTTRGVYGTQPQMFFTRRTEPGMRFTGLNLAPAVFQEAIDVAFELRVTVVGDRVFAAKVSDSSGEQLVRDWRVGHFTEKLSITPFDVPRWVEDACVEFNRCMGTMHGSFDLIVDNNDQYWFLEDNPGGQWGFVEEATGQPIGKAFAELLLSKA